MKVLIQNSVLQFLCFDDTWTKEISEARAFANSLEAMVEVLYLRANKPARNLRVLLSFDDSKYNISLPVPESVNSDAQLSRLRSRLARR